MTQKAKVAKAPLAMETKRGVIQARPCKCPEACFCGGTCPCDGECVCPTWDR